MRVGEHPKRRAVIAQTPSPDNGYSYVVCTENGTLHLRGLGAPMGEPVGARGWVQYTTGRFGGLYFWEAEVQ